MSIKEILKQDRVQVQKLQALVADAMVDENFLSSKLHDVENDDDCTFGQRVSDKVADFGGSWTFILGFGVFIVIWIIINTVMMKKAADPYPFILLNLMLSCLAALQAPIIMMSQNRQEEKDRRRARSDYMINLKAEMEIRSLHMKLDLYQKNHTEMMAKILHEKKMT